MSDFPEVDVLIEQAAPHQSFYHRYFLSCLVSLLFIFFPAISQAHASKVLILTPAMSHIDIQPYLQILPDPQQQLSWQDINSGAYENKWQAFNKSDFIEPVGGRYWFRFSLAANDDIRNTYPQLILHLPYQAILTQKLALQTNGHGRVLTTGLYSDLASRPFERSFNAIPVALDERDIHVLGYLQNEQLHIPPHFNFQLSTEQDYQQQFQANQYLYVAFYAAMMALLIYNLCLFLTLRQPLYGIYCLFIISTAMACALNDGHGLLWLWPERAEINTLMIYTTSFIPPISFLSFVYQATNKAEFWPGFTRYYHLLNGVGLITLVIFLFLPQELRLSLLLLVDIYPAIILATIMMLVVSAVYHRQPLSGYLLLAELTLLAGGISYALANQGIIELNALSNWSLHAGVVAEALLLAITLAARTRYMQQQAIQQQQLAYQYQADAMLIQESAEKFKNDFMSTITHELLTPINGITLSHNLLHDAEQDEKEKLLVNAETSTGQLLHLVESMLIFSEARTGQLALHPDSMDLTHYLDTVMLQYRNASHSYAKLELYYDKTKPHWIIADVKKLDILLHQLIKHAMQNTLHGKVIIRCETGSLSDAEAVLSIAINDQGEGISDAMLQQLRQAFDFDDDCIVRRQCGIGMGLTIVSDILQLMQGKCTIESSKTDGCCFSVDIPIQYCTEQRAPNTFDTDHKLKKILIVEDNPVNMLLMEKFLQKQNYQTFAAKHGGLALDILHQQDIDVVLMDCNMPVMDGYVATEKIRQIKAFSELPIIAVTANVSELDQRRCQDSGMNDFVAKPANMDVLTQTLNKWLKQAC